MYIGSELFAYHEKYKQEQIVVNGYKYQGSFYTKLSRQITLVYECLIDKTNIREPEVKELIQQLNDFELIYKKINNILNTNDYAEITNMVFPLSMSADEKEIFLAKFFKQKFGVNLEELRKREEKLILDQRNNLIKIFKSQKKQEKPQYQGDFFAPNLFDLEEP